MAFGKLGDLVGTLAKDAHVAIEGELRSHEYQRERAFGNQKTTISQCINREVSWFGVSKAFSAASQKRRSVQ